MNFYNSCYNNKHTLTSSEIEQNYGMVNCL